MITIDNKAFDDAVLSVITDIADVMDEREAMLWMIHGSMLGAYLRFFLTDPEEYRRGIQHFRERWHETDI